MKSYFGGLNLTALLCEIGLAEQDTHKQDFNIDYNGSKFQPAQLVLSKNICIFIKTNARVNKINLQTIEINVLLLEIYDFGN